MTTEIHTIAAVTSTAVALDVKNAQVALDETRRPYAEAILICALPDEATVDLIDPRDDVRVTLELVRNGAIKTLNLLLHGRRIDYVEATMELTLRSDEAYLIDAGLVATEPDLSAVGDRASLRAIVAGVLARYSMVLEPGSADFDFSSEVTLEATNLFTNPSAETNLTGVATTTGTITRSSAWATSGSYSFQIASPSNDDAHIGFTGSPINHGMVAGKTYTASGTIRLSAPLTGTGRAGRARRIVVFVSTNGGSSYTELTSAAAANAAGEERLWVTFSLPSNTTNAFIRFYHGHTAGIVWWDALQLTEGSALYDYFDGDSPAGEWTGTAHASTSLLYEGGPLKWAPGVTAWDFLAPLVETSGLRLFCDEYRDWYLEAANSIRDGLVIVSETINLTEAAETVSRSEEWYDSVVIKYVWSENGAQHEAYDVAGPGTKVLSQTRESAYPGPGAAEAIRRRAAGRGQVLRLLATSDYTARPWMEIIASPPHGPAQVGVVSAIEWTMPEDLMTIRSRGLVDTPETAWIFDEPGISWASVPAGIDWTEDI